MMSHLIISCFIDTLPNCHTVPKILLVKICFVLIVFQFSYTEGLGNHDLSSKVNRKITRKFVYE